VNPEVILVDEALLHEFASDDAGAVHENVLARLVFQLADGVRD
jgi:hypothetical protein